MASDDRKKYTLPANLVVPRNSRRVETYLEETDARLVSDLIPTCEITTTFPATGDRLDSIGWMNEPESDVFADYTLVDMVKEEGTDFTRLFFAKTTDITAFKQGFPARANLVLPDQLESVTVHWQESYGEGKSESQWTGSAVGTSPSLTGSEDGSAQSSASVIPEVSAVVRQAWGHNIRTTMYYMIMETTNGIVSEAEVASQLSSLFGITALPWPTFKTKTYVIALMGAKVSVRAGTRANEHVSIGSSNTSYSVVTAASEDFDFSDTTAVRTIPNVLCTGLSISSTRGKSVSAFSSIGWPGATNWLPVSISKTVTGEAKGSVSADLSATEPPTIPVTGHYILNIMTRPFTNFSGFVMVNVEILDAAILG